MIESIYDKTKVVFKDKIVCILSYIWPLPLILVFLPKKTKYLKKHLIKGILFSLFITVWMISIFYLIRTDINTSILNIVNICIITFVLLFQIIQLFLIIKKKNYY